MNTTANHSPGNFPDRVEAEDIVVKYSDLHEIQQGSPYIGKLSVNGVLLSGLFGGPALIARNAVYAPRFVKSEWKPDHAVQPRRNAAGFAAARCLAGTNRRWYPLLPPGSFPGCSCFHPIHSRAVPLPDFLRSTHVAPFTCERSTTVRLFP